MSGIKIHFREFLYNFALKRNKLLGANIVITGEISGSEDTRRLTMKALDVKTGEIIANAREQL